MAVAEAEGSVDLFEWDFEQVSYGLLYRILFCFLILLTRLDVETTAPC
jgi:hypothetical protein